jgi:phospholipid/cholesterol/gamma-HCH transport system substrate-binding protein
MTSRARTGKKRLPNFWVGVIAILLVVIGLWLSFTKKLPFTGEGYQIKAVVANAQNIAEKSPVRIAGVEVGKVTTIEPLPDSNAAELTMTIEDNGRPIHEDARIQIRPRLFLEGNLFVDMQPGSPSAPEMESGDTIPIQQTYNSVQLDELLTGLQSEVRGNMQLLLRELGDAFDRYGGAEGLREFNRSGADAFQYTSQVNEAVLGTEEGDLAGFTRNFARVAQALNQNDTQLQSLVTNLRVVTGSFAAESGSLQESLRLLPGVLDQADPVFANLNSSFPALRAFAVEALPGVRSTGPTIDVSLPFIRQLRALVSDDELRGLTRDLRATIPSLASLTRRQIPFLEQARAVSSCFTNVIIPWSADEVGNGQTDGAGDVINPVYQETAYGLVGIGGESRSGDANGQYIRVGGGGGVNTVVSGNGDVGVVPFPIEGSEPDIDSSRKTPFRPNIPCENQEPPDMRSQPGPAPAVARQPGASESLLNGPLANTRYADITREAITLWEDWMQLQDSDPSELRRDDSELSDLRERLLEFDREQMPEYLRMLRERDFE